MLHVGTSDARPRALFVIERGVGRHRGYRYICGGCGDALIYRPTRELLDFTFLCKTCQTVNGPPFEAKSA
jgi:hypothetical protein